MVTDDSAINTPAVAAAHVIRRYSAQANDEISFEVRQNDVNPQSLTPHLVVMGHLNHQH